MVIHTRIDLTDIPVFFTPSVDAYTEPDNDDKVLFKRRL